MPRHLDGPREDHPMTEPFILPPLMVAPNGARLTDDDHRAVPVTIPQIVAAARRAADAGAGAMHFHVRDADKAHILDAGLYREALAELAIAVPEIHHQITTETVGRYGPEDMRKVTREVVPPGVSIGVKEMIPTGGPTAEDVAFYSWLAESGIRTQHICYQPEHVHLLAELLEAAGLPKAGPWCLFVIGHYTGAISHPHLIDDFLAEMKKEGIEGDWAICAFREEEAACIRHAVSLGGKLRVGFENSQFMADGSIAPDNESRVAEAAAMMAAGRT